MKMKFGKIFITCTLLWIIAICFIVFSSLTYELRESEAAPSDMVIQSPDENREAPGENYKRASREHKEGGSAGRTLSEYYSRRQYPGSPPRSHTLSRFTVSCLSVLHVMLTAAGRHS